jgi:hypothetical protein
VTTAEFALKPAPSGRPILFSAPMVRAILAGKKTQTRRVAREYSHDPSGAPHAKHYMRRRDGVWDSFETFGELVRRHCRYGQPGDRLWVRETWRTEPGGEPSMPDGIRYAADNAFRPIANTREASDLWVEDYDNGRHGTKWRPSIFLRRWASRITLEVTGVRVERLREIGEDDAKAEGVTIPTYDRGFEPFEMYGRKWGPHRIAFQYLWESINGAESWHANPWVWVIEFRRVAL